RVHDGSTMIAKLRDCECLVARIQVLRPEAYVHVAAEVEQNLASVRRGFDGLPLAHSSSPSTTSATRLPARYGNACASWMPVICSPATRCACSITDNTGASSILARSAS